MNTTHVSAQSHHLPQQFTSFVGREEELSTICERLADPACRLLTLVGPGGIGKTRLAIQATAVTPTHFPDGTYFINLQSITKPELLATTIADTLDLTLSGQEVPLRQLCRFLASKRLLLTLDPFEQLIGSLDFILELLHQTAVSILVTSREPLNLQEEWLFPIHGLTGGDNQEAALKLFADRAQRVQPHFNLVDEKADVINICQLVEGMPLAIELAAAWTRSLPCTDISNEIQASLDFLSTSVRNVPERHRSIQNIFEQTWQQLSANEQTVFRRLSMFHGGFRREAATDVAGANLLILSDLIDKSLLRWESDNEGNGRYQIHELLRQFAAEKLAENKTEAAETREKHIQYFTAFLDTRLDSLLSNQQNSAMRDIQIDFENIRFVWQQLINSFDFARLKQAAMPLLSFYWYRSWFLEGYDTFAQLVDRLNDVPPSLERDTVLAIALNNQATFLMVLGDFEESNRLASASQKIYETHQLPPPHGMDTDPRLTMSNNSRLLGNSETAVSLAQAALKHNLPIHRRNAQEAYRMIAEAQIALHELDEAWQHAEKALTLAEEVNELSRLAYTHETLGDIAFAQGRDNKAEYHYQESYQIWAQLGHEIGRADMLQRLGDLALRRQAYQEAQGYYEQILPLFEKRHVLGGILGSLVRLGQTAVCQAEYEVARQYFYRAIPIAFDYHNQFGSLTTRLMLESAALHIKIGRHREAASLLSFLVDHPQLADDDPTRVKTLIEVCHTKMTADAYETAVIQGQTTPLENHLNDLQTQFTTPLPAPAKPKTAAGSTATPLANPLTPRELEVLQLIADGFSNQDIADKLFISKGTVKYYSSHIYKKLQVSNRTHAVATARELGLLQES